MERFSTEELLFFIQVSEPVCDTRVRGLLSHLSGIKSKRGTHADNRTLVAHLLKALKKMGKLDYDYSHKVWIAITPAVR